MLQLPDSQYADSTQEQFNIYLLACTFNFFTLYFPHPNSKDPIIIIRWSYDEQSNGSLSE